MDRDGAGDVNQDGYNESTGAYQVIAAGREIEITLTPQGSSILRPVIDVRGLPPGDVQAVLEGVLQADVVRLADDRCLMMLPGRIQGAAVLDVRVK